MQLLLCPPPPKKKALTSRDVRALVLGATKVVKSRPKMLQLIEICFSYHKENIAVAV